MSNQMKDKNIFLDRQTNKELQVNYIVSWLSDINHNRLVSFSFDMTIKVWDIFKSDQLDLTNILTGHKN